MAVVVVAEVADIMEVMAATVGDMEAGMEVEVEVIHRAADLRWPTIRRKYTHSPNLVPHPYPTLHPPVKAPITGRRSSPTTGSSSGDGRRMERGGETGVGRAAVPRIGKASIERGRSGVATVGTTSPTITSMLISGPDIISRFAPSRSFTWGIRGFITAVIPS